MKMCTLYVLATVLGITNFNALEKVTNMMKSVQIIKEEVEGKYKDFIDKVMTEKGFKEKIEKLGDLKEGINKKKSLAKEKSKERKAMKLLRKQNKSEHSHQVDENSIDE